jgi:hypothetical protein
MSEGSVGALPMTGNDRPTRAFKKDRTCGEPGCGTKLSIYNRAPHAGQEDRLNSGSCRAGRDCGAVPHGYDRMMAPLAAVVWHHWLSIVILVPSVLIPVGILVGYLAKVVAPRYGRR